MARRSRTSNAPNRERRGSDASRRRNLRTSATPAPLIDYKFHPEAALEFEEAAAFYESRMAGLGVSFAAEVERTVSLIRQFPDAGTLVGGSRRRVSLHGFPYSIVYAQDRDIVIIAVAHQRKRPRY